MKKIIINMLFAFILISACNRKLNYGQFLNQQLKMYYSSYTSSYDTIIIMPREGCNACINDANSFFERNYDNVSFLFIFTKIRSQKELKLMFGEEKLNADNVLIDENNLFHIFDETDSHYPLILTKKEDKYSYNKLIF